MNISLSAGKFQDLGASSSIDSFFVQKSVSSSPAKSCQNEKAIAAASQYWEAAETKDAVEKLNKDHSHKGIAAYFTMGQATNANYHTEMQNKKLNCTSEIAISADQKLCSAADDNSNQTHIKTDVPTATSVNKHSITSFFIQNPLENLSQASINKQIPKGKTHTSKSSFFALKVAQKLQDTALMSDSSSEATDFRGLDIFKTAGDDATSSSSISVVQANRQAENHPDICMKDNDSVCRFQRDSKQGMFSECSQRESTSKQLNLEQYIDDNQITLGQNKEEILLAENFRGYPQNLFSGKKAQYSDLAEIANNIKPTSPSRKHIHVDGKHNSRRNYTASDVFNEDEGGDQASDADMPESNILPTTDAESLSVTSYHDMVLCTQCGKQVSPFEMPEHLDYHFALQLQRQSYLPNMQNDRKPASGVKNLLGSSTKCKNSRKRTKRESSVSNKTLLDFFKPG